MNKILSPLLVILGIMISISSVAQLSILSFAVGTLLTGYGLYLLEKEFFA